MARDDEDARLIGERLRSAAERIAAGPAPVDEVVRRGRRAAARRRVVVAGATVAAVAAVAVPLAVAGQRSAEEHGAPEPVRPAEPSPRESAAGPPRLVDAYEPVAVDGGRVLVLFPEGMRYVLMPEEATEEQVAAEVEEAHSLPDALPPEDALSGALSVWSGRVTSVDGIWHSDDGVSRVVVTPVADGRTAGRGYEAQVYQVGGASDWGVFHLDTGGLDMGAEVSVTAFDGRGEVFETATFDVP